MVERVTQSPEVKAASEFKMHLLSHTMTRAIIGDQGEVLKSAETLMDVVEVLQNLDDEPRGRLVKILRRWVKVPKRRGYKSSLTGESVRQVLVSSGLLLDNQS